MKKNAFLKFYLEHTRTFYLFKLDKQRLAVMTAHESHYILVFHTPSKTGLSLRDAVVI